MFQFIALPLRIMGKIYTIQQAKIKANREGNGPPLPTPSRTRSLTTEQFSPFELTLSDEQKLALKSIMLLVVNHDTPVPSADVLAPLVLRFFVTILEWSPPQDQGLNNAIFKPPYLQQFTALSMVTADGLYKSPVALSYLYSIEIRTLFTTVVIDAYKSEMGNLSKLPSSEQLRILLEERERPVAQRPARSKPGTGEQLGAEVDFAEAEDVDSIEITGSGDESESTVYEHADHDACLESSWDIPVLESGKEARKLLDDIFPGSGETLEDAETDLEPESGSILNTEADSTIPQPQDSAFAKYVFWRSLRLR